MFMKAVGRREMHPIVLTIDVEDWFHILDNDAVGNVDSWLSRESRIEANVDRILSILNERDLKATFFCLGWVAEHYPGVIRRISSEGHEIASHSYHHTLVYTMSEMSFKQDALRSRSLLEDVSGEEVIGYRAPGFSINASVPWFFDALSECGYKYDSSVFRANRAHGGWTNFATDGVGRAPNSEILEIPLEPASILGKKIFWSGGGYFRITPTLFHKFLVARTNNTVFYLHPRDLDVDQPKLSLSPKRHFKYYAGLQYTESRFKNFLTNFEFQVCKDVWSKNLSR